jgi:hypothetical protein
MMMMMLITATGWTTIFYPHHLHLHHKWREWNSQFTGLHHKPLPLQFILIHLMTAGKIYSPSWIYPMIINSPFAKTLQSQLQFRLHFSPINPPQATKPRVMVGYPILTLPHHHHSLQLRNQLNLVHQPRFQPQWMPHTSLLSQFMKTISMYSDHNLL